MKIRPEEITGIIQKQITNYYATVDVKEVGYVLQVGDGIARIYGMKAVMAGEMVKFPNDIFGMVFNLEEGAQKTTRLFVMRRQFVANPTTGLPFSS